MTDAQRNKMDTYRAVKGVLDTNTELLSAHPYMQQQVEAFNLLFGEVLKNANEQNPDYSGLTTDKKNAKEAAVRAAIPLAGVAASYAWDQNDMDLKNMLDYSYSDLAQVSDGEALSELRSIESALKEHTDALSPYMVSAADIEALEAAIDRFQAMLNLKGEARSVSITATRQLAISIGNMDRFLQTRLDPLFGRIRYEQPRLYDIYRTARKIVDR